MPKACELRAEHAVLHRRTERAGQVDVATEKREFTADEKLRSDEIFSKAKAIAETISSIERFEAGERMTEADRQRPRQAPPPRDRGVQGGKYKYSLARAAVCLSEKRAVDGLEGECSQEISHRIGKNRPGLLHAHQRPDAMDDTSELPGRRRALFDASQDRAPDRRHHGRRGAVLTRWDTTWIQFLRRKQVLNQLGVTYMTDMHGNFALPRQSGIGTVTWVAETTSVSSTAQTIDQVLFTPKTVGAYTDMSRRFLEQLSIDPEIFVRDDLGDILSRGIESAVYNGTGSPQPTGILQAAGITQSSPWGPTAARRATRRRSSWRSSSARRTPTSATWPTSPRPRARPPAR